MPCSIPERSLLLGIAFRSIQTGLQTGIAYKPNTRDFPPALQQTRASFVTLKHDEALRGCIGSLQPCSPLINSVVENAFAAAFRDPRFPALTTTELDGLTIDISVLSPLQPVSYRSEADIVKQIKAARDGWVLQENRYKGTFLPSVRDALPDAHQFLKQLKVKAGLTEDYWSDSIEVWRYSTESFSACAEDAAQYAELISG